MEYSLVLLLITIARVQGFYNDFNTTSINSYDFNSVSSENRRQKQFKLEEFDNVFQHYSSEKPRREPRFISFQTKDDNIEVEIDFAIPFLSIPVKRSLSGAIGTLQNVISVSFNKEVRRFHSKSSLRLFPGHSDGERKCWCSLTDRICDCRGCDDWRNIATRERRKFH